MNSDVGKTLKTLAKFFAFLGILGSLIGAIALWVIASNTRGESSELVFYGFVVLVAGIFNAWVIGVFIYGFGELIESSQRNEATNRNIYNYLTKNVKKTEPDTSSSTKKENNVLDSYSLSRKYESESAKNKSTNQKLILPLSKLVPNQKYKNNSSIDEIIIPFGVIGIEPEAFYGSSVSSAFMPETLQYIADSAFEKCTSLTDITFGGTIEQWNQIEKADNWKKDDKSITVHCTDGDTVEN